MNAIQSITGKRLLFTAPRRLALESYTLSAPDSHSIIVEAEASLISAGTERTIYRGEIDPGTERDEILPSLKGRDFRYPFDYGYNFVGRVVRIGKDVSDDLMGERVFLYHPHSTHALVKQSEVIPVKDIPSINQALLLPAMETALSIVQDAAPVAGERVVIVGAGIIGLLVVHLLSRQVLEEISVVDPSRSKRETALQLGAGNVYSPEEFARLPETRKAGRLFDLVVELSGNIDALTPSIRCCGLEGRIVVGSWYGDQAGGAKLGSVFHRRRIKLLSSQVSHFGPALAPRWNRQRRLGVVRSLLPESPGKLLVNHRFPFSEAEAAYQLLDEEIDSVLGIRFDYS